VRTLVLAAVVVCALAAAHPAGAVYLDDGGCA
jgi:hypothetical protein